MQRLMAGQGAKSKCSPIPLRLRLRILQKMARKDCEPDNGEEGCEIVSSREWCEHCS